MRFQGKVSIVTGAAAGIARATAKLMAREGGHVVAVDINEPGLASLAEEIAAEDGQVTTMETDILDSLQVKQMIERTMERCGAINILVNVVGGIPYTEHHNALVDEMPIEEWDDLIRFNLRGTFLCTNAVIPHMKTQKSGKIVNVSSTLGYGGIDSGNVAYTAAKAGIMSFTKKVAREVGPYGITCNATAPGVTLTEGTALGYAQRPEEAKQLYLQSIPLRRVGLPEDQAKVIAFLASEDADYVTGVTINVNGGRY